MQWKDRTTASVIFIVLLGYSLGILIHRSSRFAGSAWGGVFGVGAGILMMAPLVYTLVKRVPALRRAFTRRFSFRALLDAHVYLGLVGALLALIHTGHKFQSVLGIALTAVMLLTVISGFIGQAYLRFVAEDVREKQAELGVLWRTLELRSQALSTGLLEPAATLQASAQLQSVATATAELQYALQFQERVRRLFNMWLAVHIVCSVLFYALLVLHVWAGIHFGLRWFQ